MKFSKPSRTILFSLVSILVTIFALPGVGAQSPQEVILLMDKNLEPFSYIKDGEIVGKTVDWINHIDEAMPDYDIKIKGVDWQEGLNAIREGKALGIVGTYFSGSNRSWLYPYSQPMFEEHVVVMCRANVNVSATASWPESFRGLLVLNIAGYDGWLDFKIRDRQNTELINFFEVPTEDIAYSILKKKNADCMLAEKTFAELVTARDDSDEKQKPKIVAVVSQQPIYVGYSHKAISGEGYPYALDFAKTFDFAQHKLKQEGVLQEQQK